MAYILKIAGAKIRIKMVIRTKAILEINPDIKIQKISVKKLPLLIKVFEKKAASLLLTNMTNKEFQWKFL